MSAKEVDAYLRTLKEPKRSTLETLRRTILELVPEAEQVISYRVPAFRVAGKTVAGFAAFKDHLSYLPFSGSVLKQLGNELGGYTMTKSALHFPVDRPLPKTLVKKLIRLRLAEVERHRANTPSEATTVAHALQAAAVPVPRLLEARELVPAEPGFYCWWSRRGAIAGLPLVPHPLDRKLALLYVGISPARESSRQTLRSRVLGNHLNGNVGSSTFRFVLAALLLEELDLQPFVRGAKVALNASDNARLSAWQHKQLLLTWCTRARPWEIESQVIAQLAPPLNSADNAGHPFYPTIRAVRAELRRHANEPVPLTASRRRARPS